MKFSRHWLIVLIGVASWALVACDDGCRDVPEPPEGIEGSYELNDVVPAQARAVVFSDNLGNLLMQTRFVVAALPVALPEPDEPAVWEAAGAWVDGPAVAFLHDEQWTIVAWLDTEKERKLEEWPIDGERIAVEPDTRRGAGWREMVDGDRWQSWASSDERRMARGWSLDDTSEAYDEAIWTLDEGQSRQIDARQEELSSGLVHGVVDSGLFLDRLSGEGRAGFLLDHLAEQMGELYWSVSSGESDESWRVELYAPGRIDMPVAVGDLGEARGDLPDIGGLARAGAPAVLRLSVEPERFIELVRSTLEVEERQRLDDTLSTLQNELVVDVEDDVIDNLTGQIAVVVFGLEDAFFEATGIGLVASLARLESTREAVVVPIEDRERMEQVLDAFTQLSRGGLRRQAMEHTIQYAWFDDGALEWAVILSDDHLVFVDSMVAFDHVGSWERSPSRLDATLSDRGVGEMMDGTRGLALYLDVATVRGILKEGGDEELVKWLEPFEALRIETDVDGQKERTNIEVWPSSRILGEDD